MYTNNANLNDKPYKGYSLPLRLIAMLCATVLFLSLSFVVVSAETPQEKYDRLKKELDSISSQITTNKNDKAVAEKLQTTLKQEEKIVTDLIAMNQKEVSDYEKELEKKQKQIEKKQLDYKESEELFQQRIVAIYQMNNASVLSSVLAVKNFSDFFQMIDAMTLISKNDTTLLTELQKQKEDLEEEQKEIDDVLKKLDTSYNELNSNADTLASNIQAQDQQITKNEAALKVNETAFGYTQEEANRAHQEMLDFSNSLGGAGSSPGEGIPDAGGGTGGGNTGGDTGGGNTGGGNTGGDTGGGNTGGGQTQGSVHVWPVPASRRITCHFGAKDPNGNPHLGMDIGAPMGTPIVAAGNGRVIFAGWHNSYGNYIVVDHGNAVKTLYAHCSQLLVGYGASVSAGSTIALVGSTGFSTGPHLHFEVNVNGVRHNPYNYVG